MASNESPLVRASGHVGSSDAEDQEEEESRLPAADAEVVPHSSPQLSRRALDELGQLQEVDEPGDPENYPLHSPWAFWFERSPKGATTSDFFANLRQICVVKTIKAFWCVFNNLTPVHQLQERESYHLMRDKDRRPVWEDELNAHGGMWAFKVRKEDTAAVWQEVLLAAIGEQFLKSMDEDDDVCGVSVRIRGFDRNVIQIWNMDSEQHSKSSVIQRVKELVPNIDINEYYQSNRSKMEESLRKSAHGHRRTPPPGPTGHRYAGVPPQFQPPMFPGPPYPPGAPRYPPLPHYHRHPHPPHPHGHTQRFPRHPYPAP